ncbi:hypothetical protein CONCODRAFT_9147 [Conidiobolus coronatus NRRL 28638]|uniref:Uncharacterized protein n=1 Tax=Conidiobolus coronatus (strain ATCC 28846 / CBS 209.66 / NRRL 28638) TaxID=796925 RepID=A0A137P0Z5_CONC2|nr:hypothetical protein CONCODRAFT_9147 [Conidiobolus coronatus NRRL 28638]|eukprot:KXN68554.1 hypothetical protein CONCODRAFT_9147 [Conidiobolus coronatus NRRL 28638]
MFIVVYTNNAPSSNPLFCPDFLRRLLRRECGFASQLLDYTQQEEKSLCYLVLKPPKTSADLVPVMTRVETVPIPQISKALSVHHLQLYFRFFHPACPILHPATFFKRLRQNTICDFLLYAPNMEEQSS